jgi:type III restriction enzyme
MKDKERLLSFSEPVSFIFSHSALKEGWDNPNIFQICTLRETISLMKKRQEIGRGLRLPVDIDGNRIYDPGINVLTVIANESYQEYVGQLQTEFNEAGYSGVPEPTDAREKKIEVKTTKFIDTEDFKKLWEKISKRTKYNLEVRTSELVKNAVEKINGLDMSNLVVTVDKVNIYFDKTGKIQTVFAGQSAGSNLKRDIHIQNIVDRIARETGVTKNTILDIFSKIDNLPLIFENPEEFLRSVIIFIQHSLNDLLINEGLKYTPTGEMWEIKLLFNDFEVLPSKSIKSDKSAFTRVVFDSNGEKEFAEHLENSNNVKVYSKLPRGFMVDTPLGQYIPDWAIVWKTQEGEKLYLVRETKFGYGDFLKELPLAEQQKILCAKKHFASIGFDDYDVAEQVDLSDLIK